MKHHFSVTDIAKRLQSAAARDRDSYSPPAARESFADKITRAVDARGILLGALTQKQHHENVERARNRYRSLKRRKATVSG
jgi:hypothetical protein